mgnify:CR=1 FL=1|jgi:hypothetical protein
MRLLIEEEYGYRQWVWTPQQETTKDLVNYWLNLDPNFFDSMVFLSPTNLIGIWQELKVPIGATEEEERWFYDEVLNRANYDGFGHVHNFHDSYLELNGKTYALSEFSNFARLPKE